MMKAVLDAMRAADGSEAVKALSWLHRLAWLENGIQPLLNLDSPRAEAAVVLVGAVGLANERKVALFERMVAEGSHVLAHPALGRLTANPSVEATTALRNLARRTNGCHACEQTRQTASALIGQSNCRKPFSMPSSANTASGVHSDERLPGYSFGLRTTDAGSCSGHEGLMENRFVSIDGFGCSVMRCAMPTVVSAGGSSQRRNATSTWKAASADDISGVVETMPSACARRAFTAHESSRLCNSSSISRRRCGPLRQA
jgi:hypothetical protein